jgi:hypothetical protein
MKQLLISVLFPDIFPAMYVGPAELEVPNLPISLIILFFK